MLFRSAKGVYVKARKTRFGILYPSAYELVKEISKRDKAKVIPTGATAANRLGFSTQVPMNTIFLTTGSGRKLKLGNRTVTLKHGAPKNFAVRGRLMPELVQALRSIGEHNITQDVEARIGQLFMETPETDTIERARTLNSGRLAQPCFWHFGGQRALDHLLGWEREGSTNCTLET